MRLSTILKKCLHNKNFIIGLCMVGLMVLLTYKDIMRFFVKG